MRATFNFKALIKFTAILFLASIVLLVVVLRKQPNDNYVRTQAVITDMTEEWVYDGEGDTLQTSYYVDFTANGQQYTHIPLNYAEPKYDVGKQVEIFYNPENPMDIRVNSTGLIVYLIVLASVSFIITAGGLAGLIWVRRSAH